MARILPFRRRRPAAPRFWPQPRRSPLRRAWFGLRPFLLGAILLAIWPALDPALVEPPGLLAGEPERVARAECSPVSQTDCALRFTRCGPGRGHACVVDGDTFKLGRRKIRIIGIDAPEVSGKCAEEVRLAEAATAKLQELLNQGSFEMVGRIDETTDRYGRDLRVVQRTGPDGTVQSIADAMREAGLAHRYVGFKTGWC